MAEDQSRCLKNKTDLAWAERESSCSSPVRSGEAGEESFLEGRWRTGEAPAEGLLPKCPRLLGGSARKWTNSAMKLFCLLSLFLCLASEAVLGLPPALAPVPAPVPVPAGPADQGPNLEPQNLEPRLDSSLQMVVVTTADWDAVDGTLQRFGRRETGGPWQPVGGPVAIVVGKKGMGWGTGLDRTGGPLMRSSQDPIKKEGDGKSPAGVFGFGRAFGDRAQAPPGWRLAYTPLTPTVECVDDIRSRSYNQIVDRDRVTPDWNSSEHMLSVGQAYRWGVVINNNGNPTVPAAGSCVFMHIWSGPGKGTAGCTAITERELESILAWLDPNLMPLLVQLPRAQYDRLRNLWHLPVLATP